MNRLKILLLLTITLIVSAGCSSLENITNGISQKSISGSGTFITSQVGLDSVTQTPELFNMFVWGDYTSVVPGDEILRYEESEDASIFNSDAQSKQIKMLYASGDTARMDAFLATVKARLESKTTTATTTTE